jgi:hypothetical protein
MSGTGIPDGSQYAFAPLVLAPIGLAAFAFASASRGDRTRDA